MMPKLTAGEKKWLKKVQAVLDECPSGRIAFYTIGDCDLQAYDVQKYNQISDYQNSTRSGDFCRAVEACDASFNECLIFKNPVESTSG
ncbi:TPA: hypothetical protein P7L52_003249 [Vibrio cholerae]|uniref:hypothetical protein n=2 Tax=Vibrio cholerae TaxID=666 RepID=UPI001A344F0E|nr:hypothetical protein [Vibrio cholerae]MCX9673848.1 hypothetical protein [Vibrio cholerae]MCX9698756.1 hypothetical protein [Vibrio cholerae]HAS3550378.1 hypothetical protein [Vibrio cholerae]HAS3992968.1 hypothetical protein [Vibrio cholerae]HAS3996643.1 hypothetical protein [Vibrio cholerae]